MSLIIYKSIKEYSIIHKIYYNTVKNRLNSKTKKFEEWFRVKNEKEG